jgi:hypothetical protein
MQQSMSVDKSDVQVHKANDLIFYKPHCFVVHKDVHLITQCKDGPRSLLHLAIELISEKEHYKSLTLSQGM